jgi:hypothetical protein
MQSKNLSLPTINVSFWKNENEYYSSKSLSREVITGLKHASKARLIDAMVPGFSSNADVVGEIINRIRQGDSEQDYSDTELLIIFDLIQGWGGAQGRWPYIVPKDRPHRLHYTQFCETYRRAVSQLFKIQLIGVSKDRVENANKIICELPRVGISFSSKHLQFWSIGLDLTPKLAIFDSRMKQLIAGASGCRPESVTYIEFLETLESAANQLGVSSEVYERSLFAFSKNYFPNESLQLKDKAALTEDIEVARSIAT